MRKLFIGCLGFCLFLICSSCNLNNFDHDLIEEGVIDGAESKYKYENYSEFPGFLNNDNYNTLLEIKNDLAEDSFKNVPEYFNIKLRKQYEADKLGVSYEEALVGLNNLYQLDGVNVVEEYPNYRYRKFIINDRYVITTKKFQNQVTDEFEKLNSKLYFDLFPKTYTINEGIYIDSAEGKLLVGVDNNSNEFYIEEETKYICSTIFDNCIDLKFNEYLGCLYLPSKNNPYFAFVKPVDKSLDAYSIHKDTVVVADGAFVGCENLEKIEFENVNNCIGIGYDSFYGCENLAEINWPSSLLYINENIANDLPNLNYYQKENALYLGNEENNYLMIVKILNTQIDSFSFNSQTRFILKQAFNKCENLTEIYFPNQIIFIGAYAFINCPNIIKYEIGENVKRINKYGVVIDDDDGEVIIHSKKTIYEEKAVCVNNSQVMFDGSIDDWCENIFLDSFFVGNKIQLFYKNNEDYQLCDTITIHTDISNYAFKNYQFLNKVIIENATSIGKEAFVSSQLKEIEFGKSIKTINENAFNQCNKLQRVVYEGICDDYAQIEFINIYSNPITLSHTLYLKNQNLTTMVKKVEISNNVTKINDYAFHQLDSLEEVIIGENVTYIGYASFANSDNLKKVTINSKNCEVLSFAFYSINKLNVYTQLNANIIWNELCFYNEVIIN